MKHCLVHIFPRMVLLLVIVCSCKKSNDTYPQVSITNPSGGKVYTYSDTVSIEAEIKNRDGNVTFNLLNSSGLVSIDGRLTYSEGDFYKYEIYLNDKYLAEGKYSIKVTAYNGENGTSRFVTIHYRELEKVLRGIVALSGESGFADITKYDSLGTLTQLSLPEAYQYLAVGEGRDFFMVGGPSSSSLKGYNFSDLQNTFTISSNDIPGGQKFTFLLGGREGIYVFRHDGYIKAYNRNGEVVRSYNLGEGYIPATGVFGEPGLCVVVRVEGTSSYELLILNDYNGSIRKKVSLARPVISVIYTGNSIYSFMYQEGSDLIIANYNFQTNTITEHLTLTNQSGFNLLSLNVSNALVSTSKGIQLFNPQIPFVPGTILNFAAADMDLDVVNNEVYYASGNTVLKGQGQVASNVFTTPAEIRQIEMIYNK